MKKIVAFAFLVSSCGGNVRYNADEELVSKTACESRYENGEVIMDCNGSVVNITDMVNKEMIKMFGSVENMRGPQGPRGDVGQSGRDGTSIQGAPGRDGADGLDGADGPQGPQGIPGEIGPRGNIGPQGIKGDTGTSCWDLNDNGIFDAATEDTDKDGIRSVRDCIIEYDSADGLPVVNMPVSIWACASQACRDAHPQFGVFNYATFELSCAYPNARAFVEVEFYGMGDRAYRLCTDSFRLPLIEGSEQSPFCKSSGVILLEPNTDGTLSANIYAKFDSYYLHDLPVMTGFFRKLRVTPFCVE